MLMEGQKPRNCILSGTLAVAFFERGVFAAMLLLTVVSATGFAQGKRHPAPIQRTQYSHAESALTLNLQECLSLAFERQPRLAAQRASLAMAEHGKRSLDAMRMAAALDHQVPIRRKQSGLGVSAASAGLDQAERDVVYAVARTYFTVVYARDQERLARSVVEGLTNALQAAQEALQAGVRDVTSADVNRTMVYLQLAQTKHTKASQGVKRAQVALREAIGLNPEVSVDVPAVPLPEPQARPTRLDVVSLALSRRGDLIQVGSLSQITTLEIDAQATSLHHRMPTFAAASDLHSRQFPQEDRGSEYRPGGVPPEMPPMLVGSRGVRIEHARLLKARADLLVENTRNLIALEAEDAFLRWEEASLQTRQARAAADAGATYADEMRKDYAAGLKVKVEEVVASRVLAAQARSEYYESLYRQIITLVDLERVTAGGFQANLIPPGLPGAPWHSNGGK